jgi:hypothetical protein
MLDISAFFVFNENPNDQQDCQKPRWCGQQDSAVPPCGLVGAANGSDFATLLSAWGPCD